MVDLKHPSTSNNAFHGAVPAAKSPIVQIGWKIAQFSFFGIVLWSLCRNHNQCINFPQASTTTISQDVKTTANRYARPVSDRVPKEGIETVLATSSTNPPFHFFAHSRAKDFTTNNIVSTGVYEKDSTTRLVDVIVCDTAKTAAVATKKKHYVAVDLGANIGFHSLHMASCGASVVSFEASPDTAWLLRSSALLNGFLRDTPNHPYSLTLIPQGVSNVTSTGRLSRHEKSPGMTSFIQTTNNDQNDNDNSNNHFNLQSDHQGGALDADIPLVRAQDVLRELSLSSKTHHLRLLKMDVEGLEYQALQGLNLKQFPFDYITLEFFPTLLAGSGSGVDPAELLVYIWKQGYRFLAFKGKDLPLNKYPLLETGTTETDVRNWARHMVEVGQKQSGQDYHTNLLAKRVN